MSTNSEFLRPHVIHTCWDQNQGLAFIEPFLHAPISKWKFLELWLEVIKRFKAVEKCRCNYRVSSGDASALVARSVADWQIVDWRYSEEKKHFFPVKGNNLVFGPQVYHEHEQALCKKYGVVLHANPLAMACTTIRCMTIEKGHIQKAYLEEDEYEAERIEVYGQLSSEVTLSFMEKKR